jgi:hypothetical protein
MHPLPRWALPWATSSSRCSVVGDIPRMISGRVCLALQTPVLHGRPTLRVPRAQPTSERLGVLA